MTTLEIVQRETGQAATSETRMDALGLDSLEFLELIVEVETASGRKIPESRIAELETVADLEKAVA